jgi:hypothetical protein
MIDNLVAPEGLPPSLKLWRTGFSPYRRKIKIPAKEPALWLLRKGSNRAER